MRRLITILLILFPFILKAQTYPPIVQGSKLYEFKNGVKMDSALFLPRRDTGVSDATMKAPGMLVYRNIDSLLYYLKGNTMTPLATGFADLSAYWDSVTTKANFPIDTVQTVELMEFYTGKAMLMVVTDPQRGGLFRRNKNFAFGDEIIRYPNIFGDVWDRVFDPSRGISVDWAPLDPTGGSDASAAIKNVFALPYKKFVFGAGSRYRLDDSIRIANKDSLIVDFNGATIYENVLRERTFVFYGCNALTVKNCNFDGIQNYTSFQLASTTFKLYLQIDSCNNAIIDGIRSKNKQGAVAFRKAYKFYANNIDHIGFLDDTHKTNASFCPAIYVAHDGFDTPGWNGYSVISNAHARNNGSVVLLGDDAQLYSISNIRGDSLFDNGVYLSSALYATISGCVFRYVAGSGIKARGRGFSITGNVITNAGVGIAATGNGSDSFFGAIPDDLGGNGYGTIISNNVIDSVTLKGISVEAQDGLRQHDVTVSNNTISHHINATNSALQISTTSAATVIGNKIYGSTASTAVIVNNTSGDSTQNLNFSNNTIHGCTGVGVTFNGAKNGIIHGNRFFDVTGNAMLFQSCRGNQVINNYSDGLIYNASAANSNTRNVFMLNRGSSATTDNANNAVLWNLPNTQQGITNRPWFTASTTVATSIPYIALDTVSSANWTRLSTFYSLNSLTAATQTFGTGTSGTDFNISSATSTHTFNLPTASATNRGALSSADWTTFNNKAPATGGTGYIQNQNASPQTASYNINGSATVGGNILANGGIDVSSGNLLLGTGGTTSRIISNRFIDLYGNSTGVANGALVSFYKSDGTRTGAIGDGSSIDDHFYIATNNTADFRFLTSAGNTASDPYSLPFAITNYSDSLRGRVLVGDSTANSDIKIYNKFSVNGNAQIYNTSNNSSQLEFWDGRTSGGGKLRVSVGMLGQPEANLSANMDYTTRVHKYYDSTNNAVWLALSPAGGAFAVQYASKGQPNYSQPSYDIWTNNGSRYLIWGDTTKMYTIGKIGAGLSNPLEMIHANGKIRADSGMVIYTRVNTWGIDFKRSNFSPSQGLGLNPGGGLTEFNSYDSSNAVFADYSFKSTKGSTTKVLAFIDGDSGNMGVGPSTAPSSTLQVQGAMSLPMTSLNANTTLDNTHHTIRAIASGITLTFPSASSCSGRIYVIINYNTGGTVNTSAYLSPTAVSTTTVANGTTVWVQSDGTNWYQIK